LSATDFQKGKGKQMESVLQITNPFSEWLETRTGCGELRLRLLSERCEGFQSGAVRRHRSSRH